jgi:hypothetical protein
MTKLKALAEIFNMFPARPTVLFTILLEIFTTAGQANLKAPVQPHLEILAKTIEPWTIEDDQRIALFRAAIEVAELPTLKFNLLKQLLGFETSDGINNTVKEALTICNVSQFDEILLHPAVSRVSGDLAAAVDLLKTSQDIGAAQSNTILKEIGEEKCMERIRVLILGSLEGTYSFADLAQKLGIPESAVEDHAVNAISAGVIDASID